MIWKIFFHSDKNNCAITKNEYTKRQALLKCLHFFFYGTKEVKDNCKNNFKNLNKIQELYKAHQC